MEYQGSSSHKGLKLVYFVKGNNQTREATVSVTAISVKDYTPMHQLKEVVTSMLEDVANDLKRNNLIEIVVTEEESEVTE